MLPISTKKDKFFSYFLYFAKVNIGNSEEKPFANELLNTSYHFPYFVIFHKFLFFLLMNIIIVNENRIVEKI